MLTLSAAEDIIPFLKKLCRFLHKLKCGHKIEFGRAQFLNMFIASVRLSSILKNPDSRILHFELPTVCTMYNR
jgi:hypothetical protein